MHRLAELFLIISAILAVLLLTGCSNPMGAPDPFDQALGSIMASRAANFQAQTMRLERSSR